MRFSGLLAGSLAAGCCGVAAVAAFGAPPPKPPTKPAAAAAKPPAAVAPAGAVSPEGAEFFEKNVRPLLAESCFACHGDKVQQAGLRLDTAAGLLKGTDTGKPGLVAGDPEKSLIIQAVRYTGPVKMPPAGKLPEKSIDALVQWVKMGAPWPAAGSDAQSAIRDPQSAIKSHWAWQPVRKPATPRVKRKAWVKSEIDALVLAKLEAKGIAPSAQADRYTLIRRAYYDLIGLPPTAEQIRAFENDKSPNAWEKVVDSLLASPHYGERWGRYWLDVARYADTKGYVFQEERKYPYAYTFRDWVVNALNRDLPYDRFLIDQIAADQVTQGDDKHDLAAMGFLTVGRRFLNSQPDIIDDRIDVLMRGTQALTVGCARCHDHKFDPIPTKDYYSLYGVFASSSEPRDLPLIAEPQKNAAYAAFEKELGTLEGAVQSFKQTKHGEILKRARETVGISMLAARDGLQPGADVRGIAQKREIPAGLINRWMTFLNNTAKGHHPVFSPWIELSRVPDAEFAAKGPAMIAAFAANADKGRPVNPHVAKLFAEPAPKTLDEIAQRYGALLATPPAGDDQLGHALDSIDCPLNIDVEGAFQLYNRADRNQLQSLQQKADKFRASSPSAPPRAMVLVDNSTPFQPHVFRRGNPNMPGEAVPREFVAVLAGPDRKPFEKGSGRLELAQAIASKQNPVTARVMMNRVWMYHMGTPLVRTPGDFGTRSEPPSNPELLDYLAWKFMDGDWSLKKMHRAIMLSAAYQQVSEDNPASRKVDPENALYWRMNRRRLDFEAMRDSLLYVSGKLDEALGGPAVELTAQPSPTRRTLYGFVDRQNLPNLFRTFDFASPDATSPMRYHTTVPQQALFLMNSPFIVSQAKALMGRSEIQGAKTAAEKVQALYRLALAREAAPDEVTLGLRFLKTAEAGPSEAPESATQAWQYGFGEVDEGAGRVKGFQALAHFTGSVWQGGPALPDPKIGFVSLTASGGHPGNDQQHDVIRRWTAPRDAVIAISGTLGHGSEQGDGVLARIISSRGGVLGSWTAQNSKQETPLQRVEVKKGETLDFVVDCRTGPSFDSFEWAPVITPVVEGSSTAEHSGGWSARTNFGGPQDTSKELSAWEKYAQVLLLTNEFMFVD